MKRQSIFNFITFPPSNSIVSYYDASAGSNIYVHSGITTGTALREKLMKNNPKLLFNSNSYVTL
jgi:hypothetical protein